MAFQRAAGLACLVLAAALVAPVSAGRKLQQATSYNTYPGCTFVQDLPIVADPNYSIFAQAVTTTGLSSVLGQISSSITTGSNTAVTVFAPTNAAFTDFLKDENVTLAQLLALPVLLPTLEYHVVPLPFSNTRSFSTGQVLPTLAPPLGTQNLTVAVANSTVSILGYGSEANIISGPYLACNVIFYGIDGVLVPEADVDLVSPTFAAYLTNLLAPGGAETPQNLIFSAVAAGQAPQVATAFTAAIRAGELSQVQRVAYAVAAAPGGVPTIAPVLQQIYVQSGNSCASVAPLLTSVNMALAGSASTLSSYLSSPTYASNLGTCTQSAAIGRH